MIELEYEFRYTVWKKDGTGKSNALRVTVGGLQQAVEAAENKLAPIMQDPDVDGVTIWSIKFIKGKMTLKEETNE